MQKRWEVERAVLGSQLEPPARLLVLALLAKAQNKTAVILPEHTPSLTTIQAMTGLARSAIAEWLAALENAGWLTRTKPPKHTRDVRTLYALHVGESTATRPPRPPSKKASSTQDGLLEVRKADHPTPDSPKAGSPPRGPLSGGSSPPSGTPVVRTTDASSPPGVPATTKSSPTENSHTETPPLVDVESAAGGVATTRRRKPPAPPTPGTVHAGLVVGAYVEGALGAGKPMPAERLRNQVGKDAKALLAEPGQDPELILKAAREMGAAGWFNLPVQLQRPIRQSTNGRHQAHMNDPNANYHEEL